DADRFLRGGGWKNVRRTHQAKGSEHRHDFLLSLRLGKALEFRKLSKSGMWMAIFLGNLNDSVKVHEFLFDVLRRSLQNGIWNIGPSIQLAAHHSQIELGTRIAGDEFRFLEAEEPGKQ